MPNNPFTRTVPAKRMVQPNNKVARGIEVHAIITSSQTPAASNGSQVTGGPSQRPSLNPQPGGGGGGGSLN